MVKPQQTHIDFHDLITIFNDIIAKHINNINEKRIEINNLADKNYIITNKYNDQIERVEEAEKETNATEEEKERIFILLTQEKAKVRKLEERIKELESDGALIELKNANKLSHERITDLENDLTESEKKRMKSLKKH